MYHRNDFCFLRPIVQPDSLNFRKFELIHCKKIYSAAKINENVKQVLRKIFFFSLSVLSIPSSDRLTKEQKFYRN